MMHGPEMRQRYEAFCDAGGTPDVFLKLKPWENVKSSYRIEGIDQILKDLRDDSLEHGGPNEFNRLVGEYQMAHNCGKAEAIEKCIGRYPRAHEAYIRFVNNSKVSVEDQNQC